MMGGFVMSVEEKLVSLGITLPEPPSPAGLYSPFVQTGNLVFASGVIPVSKDAAPKGRVGAELSLEEGQEAARLCILNMLSAFRRDFGSLDRIVRVVKLVVFVQSTDDFHQQAAVANGASQLMLDIFGTPAPARSAVGANAMPLDVPVEIEAVIEIDSIKE